MGKSSGRPIGEGKMKAVARALAAIVLGVSPCRLFSQPSPVPYAGGPGETFLSVLASAVYPGTYASIRKVDFRNLSYPDPAGVSLKNRPFDLDAIYYLKSPHSSSAESALVLSPWFAAGGRSNQGEEARVFTVSGGRLRLVQEILWSMLSGVQAANSFDAKANVLLIRSDHYTPEDALCCISPVDVVRFHWDGAHLVQTGIRTEYRKSEGKTLPQR
jgi:hypothetical protein